MHSKNKHQNSYDIDALCRAYPPLAEFVFVNNYGTKTIQFSEAKAVKALNTALLKRHYKITYWEFPEYHLCPPIPSRADYIHHLNDLIGNAKNVKILDIGTGATLIYPLLGNAIYHWQFVGTDIDRKALINAQKIVDNNQLQSQISLRHQTNPKEILQGIVNQNDIFTASMCNPPFYKSEAEAQKANSRKNKSLHRHDKNSIQHRNFSGQSNELWYAGGELAFITKYIAESIRFQTQFTWFTGLVSNKDNLRPLLKILKKNKAKYQVIEMQQGQKKMHILAWRFV